MPSDLDIFNSAIGAMFEPVEDIAAEVGTDGTTGYVPPYGVLLSPALCPASALPYLAQFVGVSIPSGASEAEARKLVKEHAGFERGTLDSLEGAIERVIGSSSFTVQERTNPKTAEGNEPYWVTILVGKEAATAELYAAINAVIPAGVMYEVIEVEGAWLAGEKAWGEIGAGVKWSELKKGNF